MLRKTVQWLGNTCSIAIWVRTGAYLSCIWPANEVMFLGMECTWCLIWRTPTYWKVWRNRSVLFDILLETRGREGCKKITSFHCVVQTKRLFRSNDWIITLKYTRINIHCLITFFHSSTSKAPTKSSQTIYYNPILTYNLLLNPKLSGM